MTKEKFIEKMLVVFGSYISLSGNEIIFRNDTTLSIPENFEALFTFNKLENTIIYIQNNDSAEFLIKRFEPFFTEQIIKNDSLEISLQEKISDKLCIFIFNQLPNEKRRIPIPSSFINEYLKQDSTIFDFLRIAFRPYHSLKVTSLITENNIDYIQYAKSFIFNSAMLKHRSFALVESSDILSTELRSPTRFFPKSELDIPYRKYIDDVVQYFIEGTAARVPKIKFLSFYNVLEYFFDKIYIDDKCLKIQKIITNPKFNHNNLNNYKKILEALDIKKAKNLEKNMFSEIEALKLLLTKYIDVEDFKIFLQNCPLYCNTDAHKIPNTTFSLIDSNENLIAKMCNRIYKVRNALVHSKESENIRYLPQKDDSYIQNEIALIRYLAQEVIINTSTLIK